MVDRLLKLASYGNLFSAAGVAIAAGLLSQLPGIVADLLGGVLLVLAVRRYVVPRVLGK